MVSTFNPANPFNLPNYGNPFNLTNLSNTSQSIPISQSVSLPQSTMAPKTMDVSTTQTPLFLGSTNIPSPFQPTQINVAQFQADLNKGKIKLQSTSTPPVVLDRGPGQYYNPITKQGMSALKDPGTGYIKETYLQSQNRMSMPSTSGINTGLSYFNMGTTPFSQFTFKPQSVAPIVTKPPLVEIPTKVYTQQTKFGMDSKPAQPATLTISTTPPSDWKGVPYAMPTTSPVIDSSTKFTVVTEKPKTSGLVSSETSAAFSNMIAEGVFTPKPIVNLDQKISIPAAVPPEVLAAQSKAAFEFMSMRDKSFNTPEYRALATQYEKDVYIAYQQKISKMTPDERAKYVPTQVEVDAILKESRKITGDPKLDYQGDPITNPYLSEKERDQIAEGTSPDWYKEQEKRWQNSPGPTIQWANIAATSVSTANAQLDKLILDKQKFDSDNKIKETLDKYNTESAALDKDTQAILKKYEYATTIQDGKKAISQEAYPFYLRDIKNANVDERYNNLKAIEPDLDKNIKESERLQGKIDSAYGIATKKYDFALSMNTAAERAIADQFKPTDKYKDLLATSSIPTIAYIQKYGIDTSSSLDRKLGIDDFTKADRVYYKDLNIPNKTIGELGENVIKTYEQDKNINKTLNNNIDLGVAGANLLLLPGNIGWGIVGALGGPKVPGPDTSEWKIGPNIDLGPATVSKEEYIAGLEKQVAQLKNQPIYTQALNFGGVKPKTQIDYLQQQIDDAKKPGAPSLYPTPVTNARDLLGLAATPGYVGGETLRGLPAATAANKAEFADKARQDALSGNMEIYNKVRDYIRGYKEVPEQIFGNKTGKMTRQYLYENDRYFIDKTSDGAYKKAYEDALKLSEEQFKNKYLMISKSKIESQSAQTYAVGQLGTELALIFAPTPSKITAPALAFKTIQKATLANMLIQGQSGTQATSNLAAGFGTGALFNTLMKGGSYLDAKLVDKLGGGMRTKNVIMTVDNASEAVKLQKAGLLGKAIEAGKIVPKVTQVSSYATTPWIAGVEKVGGVVAQYGLPAYFTGTMAVQYKDLIDIARTQGLEQYREAKKDASSSLAGLLLGAPIGTAATDKLFYSEIPFVNIARTARDIDIQQAALPDPLSPGRGNPIQRMTIQEGTLVKVPGSPFTPEGQFVVGKSNIKIIDTAASPLKDPTVTQYKSDAALAYDKRLKEAGEVAKNRKFDEAIDYTQWSDLKTKGGGVGSRVTKALEGWKDYLIKNSTDVGVGGSSSSAWSYLKETADKIFKTSPELKAKDFDVVVKSLVAEGIMTEAQAVKAAQSFTQKGLNVAIQKDYGTVDVAGEFIKNPTTDVVIHRGQGGWEVSLKTGKPGVSEHFASIHGMKASGLFDQVNTVNDLFDFSRTTDWIKTKEGISVFNPATQARRKLAGGYTDARPKDIEWFKNVAYEGYKPYTGGATRPIMEATASNLSSLSKPQLKLVLQTLATPSKEFTGSKADAIRLRDAIRLVDAETGIFTLGSHMKMGTHGFYKPDYFSEGSISVNPLISKGRKSEVLLHEIQHSVDPLVRQSPGRTFETRDGYPVAKNTEQILRDAKSVMDEKTYNEMKRQFDRQTKNYTPDNINVEALSYFAMFAPKEVLNPSTTTGKYINQNLNKYGNIRTKQGAQVTSKLEAFDLLGNKRPVFAVERSVVLNPYETPTTQANIIKVAGNKQINVSTTPADVKLFKDTGFLNTKNIFFPAGEGQFSMTRFAQNQFINPKDIVSSTWTLRGPNQPKGPSIVLSLPEIQLRQKLNDMSPEERSKYKLTEAEKEIINRNLREQLTGDLISTTAPSGNISITGKKMLTDLYNKYVSHVTEMNTINKQAGLDSLVRPKPTIEQFLKEMKTVERGLGTPSAEAKIVNAVMSKMKPPTQTEGPIKNPTARQIENAGALPIKFGFNNVEKLGRFSNLSSQEKFDLYNEFITAVKIENTQNITQAGKSMNPRIPNFNEFAAQATRFQQDVATTLKDPTFGNNLYGINTSRPLSRLPKEFPIIASAPLPAPLTFSTTSIPKVSVTTQTVNYAAGPWAVIPGVPQEALIKQEIPKEEKYDIYKNAKDLFNTQKDAYTPKDEYIPIISDTLPFKDYTKIEPTSSKIPPYTEPYLPPYTPSIPYIQPYTPPAPYTPPYTPIDPYVTPYDYPKYDYTKYDYQKQAYDYTYPKYGYPYSPPPYGYLMPAQYGAPPVGGPTGKKGTRDGKSKKTKGLIQFKSSLFRKFAFGEKDLLVNQQDLGAFKNIIAQRGTFFGYDVVPTMEQISREEKRLLKSRAEENILKPSDKSFLDIKV